MKNSQITIANTPAQIRRCHPVMRQLRPLFQDPEHFVERVLRQQKQRYLLAFLEFDGEVCAIAGYRFLESLFSGKFLYVDDLVTREGDRSRGFGGELLDWLIKQGTRAWLRESGTRFRSAAIRRSPLLSAQANEHFILPLSD